MVQIKNKKRAREHYAIIAAILKACEERVLRTHVLYLSNISSEMLQEYIARAMNAGLLVESATDRSLFITERGRFYLENYDVIEGLLEDKQDIRESISQ